MVLNAFWFALVFETNPDATKAAYALEGELNL
jgi:hypothetical protein